MAPITFAWGFLEIAFETASEGLLEWQRSLSPNIQTASLREELPQALRHLEPLTMPPQKALLLETRGPWCAYFDNGKNGGDPCGGIGYLAQHLHCRGVAVACVPNTLTTREKTAKGTYGGVKFELFAPEKREWLNYERSVIAMNDGGKWIFEARGTMQPFEKPEHYLAKRIRDRFTPEMLESYCTALRIRLFDADYYGPTGLVIQRGDPATLLQGISLREAQERLGII